MVSLTEFILDEQRKHPEASGDFTLLLLQLADAGKAIASHIRRAGLLDVLGKTGSTNTSHDEVIQLDAYANDLLAETLAASGQVHAVASEEMEEVHHVEKHSGEYNVFLDPLDGSANTETNATVGTIFSITHKDKGALPKGDDQIAAGYILYGSSTLFVYATEHGVNGFTLDPSVGTFLLSHKQVQIPKSGKYFSMNEGNTALLDEKTQAFVQAIHEEKDYKFRYIGTMIADTHRTLLQGGIFLYPADSEKPDGKLRLLFEVNPAAFIIEKAGGKSLSGEVSPLTMTPSSLHQRAPIVLGSPENVREYLKLIG